MAADPRARSGQSLIEFVLILPIIVGMLLVMVRVSSSIQVSIVNQKYSRQRVFEVADNGAYYPRLGRFEEQFAPKLTNRMVIGVSEELATGESIVPAATEQRITRNSRGESGSQEIQKEPDSRGLVRVRNTVELCTPMRIGRCRGANPKVLDLRDMTEDCPSRGPYCRSGPNEQ